MVKYKGLDSSRCQSRAVSELAAAACLAAACPPQAELSLPPLSHADTVWQRGTDRPAPASPPCSHGRPRPQSLLCWPGMEGVALKHGQPSALCHFLTWGTLESSSPFKTMEREKQICGFLHIKNPGTYLGILKPRSRLLIGSGHNSPAALTESPLCHKLPAKPSRQSSPANFFPLRKRSCFTSCYGCA